MAATGRSDDSSDLLGQLRTATAAGASPAHVAAAQGYQGRGAASRPAPKRAVGPPPGMRANPARRAAPDGAPNDAAMQVDSAALMALLRKSGAESVGAAAPGAPNKFGSAPPTAAEALVGAPRTAPPPSAMRSPVAPTSRPSKGIGRFVPAYLNPKYRLATFKGSRVGREDPNSPYMQFMKRNVRMGFIRKVFGILTLQLAVTFGIVCLFVLHEGVKTFVQENPGVFYAAWVTTLVMMVLLICFDDVRREFPKNYIFLAIFTLSEAYLIGTVSSYYDTTTLLMIIVFTMTITGCSASYACQTKYDWTKYGSLLFCGIILLILVGLAAAILPDRGPQIAYGALGTCLFAGFIIYDVQTVVGGQHRKYSIGPDEYVFAALNIYLDVINLFILMLVLIGGKATQ